MSEDWPSGSGTGKGPNPPTGRSARRVTPAFQTASLPPGRLEIRRYPRPLLPTFNHARPPDGWRIRVDRYFVLITITQVGCRNMSFSTKEVSREILLSFWKVHILHHAGKAPLHGQWMLSNPL